MLAIQRSFVNLFLNSKKRVEFQLSKYQYRKNMKTFKLFVLAILASLSGFIIHVVSVEWLPSWIASQMNGIEIKPSWAVRYVAAATSVEYGIATVILYSLVRERINKAGLIKASLLLSALLLALDALLIRQPLMDFLVGNPIHVVLVQNLFKWFTPIALSFIVVFGYEYINQKK